ncbi:transcriptional repressor LexA [Candidatus Latescibacterota bacterium]
MKKVLTKRQQDILDFIESFQKERGYPPTLRDIGNEFGIKSTNGVRVNLAALEKKQYIIRRPWLSRGIELINVPKVEPTDSEVGYVPIIGKVAAGEPIFSSENIEGMLAVDDTFLKTKKVFALKVKGDSMKNVGIMDGDLVLARRQHTAESGEIIVFIINDEITVKRYDSEGDKVYLIPENDDFETTMIRKTSSDLQIAGKVVGLMRKY